jgi:ATP-dependent Clp protease protease subunit
VFAAAQIYNMLMDYTGAVMVKIDGLAASAASIIAMAGGEVHMSPVSMLMVHNPSTIAIGDSEEMLKAKALLDEVKESIINAYELKTGLSRTRLSHLMSEETWMNAHKAIELGFADKIMFTEENKPQDDGEGLIFSRMAVTNSLLSKFPKKKPAEQTLAEQKPIGTPIDVAKAIPVEWLDKRLSLISH